MALCVSCSFLRAQQLDTTMAILEDKSRSKQIADAVYAQKIKKNKVWVLYKEKFYRLSDFDLQDSISRADLTIKIINDKDSIKEMLSQNVESVIILKDTKKRDAAGKWPIHD